MHLPSALRLHYTYPSQKNGTVVVWRSYPWSRWQLAASGFGQTTHYTNGMWREITENVAHMRAGAQTQRVFIGGLGGAGHLPILKQHFPSCQITVVEHDPAVIHAVRAHGMCTTPDTTIIEGDLFEELGRLTTAGKRFDLVCVDIFTGKHPSPETAEVVAATRIKAALAPGGIVVANVFQNPEYLGSLKRAFAHHSEVEYRANTLGLFWDEEL